LDERASSLKGPSVKTTIVPGTGSSQICRTLAVDGRTFWIEAIRDQERGVWVAVAGEGEEPRLWIRLPLSYDTAAEALAAAAGGVVRLAEVERRARCQATSLVTAAGAARCAASITRPAPAQPPARSAPG
jgi:hypothetical protein